MNSGAKDKTLTLLTQTNEKCEWLWEIYFKFVIVGSVFTFIFATCGSILFSWIINGHYDHNYVFHPLKVL